MAATTGVETPGDVFHPTAEIVRNPMVYEVLARPWLHEQGCETLADVPDAELYRLRRLGVNYLWLCGVWTLGRNGPALNQKQQPVWARDLPDVEFDDIIGSPFAVLRYEPLEALGGFEGLAAFRARLHQVGLGLMLDFVPNHSATDHPGGDFGPSDWISNNRGGFYTGATGKDTVSRWDDTHQLNYWNEGTRRKVIQLYQKVATLCDGIRVDMAHLVVEFPGASHWSAVYTPTSPEVHAIAQFWLGANAAARRVAAPNRLLLLAEAYDDQFDLTKNQGFDFSYDQTLYWRMLGDKRSYNTPNCDSIRAHVIGGGVTGVLATGAHYIENHDEPRAIGDRFGCWKRADAAAALVFTLPGLRLINHGQLANWHMRQKVQLLRCGGPVSFFYQRLLALLRDNMLHHPGCTFTGPLYGMGDTAWRIIAWKWTCKMHHKEWLVACNYSGDWANPNEEAATARFTVPNVPTSVVELTVKDLLTDREWKVAGTSIVGWGGLIVILRCWEVQVLEYDIA